MRKQTVEKYREGEFRNIDTDGCTESIYLNKLLDTI